VRYFFIIFLLTGCQITSISPDGHGPGLDISVDWSKDMIRHGLTYFGRKQSTEVIESDEESIMRGKSLYQIHCLDCHGPKGKGDGILGKTLKLEPADLSQLNLGASRPLLVMVVKRGRASMPRWENLLTHQQSVDVTNYILTLGR
jgi:mono/diheme cytochrome c family protein